MLRRTSIILGISGAVLLVAFSSQVSTLTFGDDQHALAVALLSLAVLFSLVSGGQGVFIEGMRRIADLARMGILGSFFGRIDQQHLLCIFCVKGGWYRPSLALPR